MRILVDMDGILVDFLRGFLRAYNSKYNDTLRKVDVVDWELSRIVKPSCGEAGVLGIMDEDHFFDRLEPLPGAVEGVVQLNALGHEVLIATAASSADSARAKLTWIQHYLGWGRQRVIITSQKHLIDADVLIDDKPLTLRRWKAERWPNALAMTIAYPYNRVISAVVDVDAHSYEDTTHAWDEIVRALS